MTARLKDEYLKQVVPELQSRLGVKNAMQLPKLQKIVLSIGLGEAIQNAKALESAERDLATVSGQHPVITRAKKSVAAFKLRSGMPIGVMVTLRGKRMYDFFDRLVNVVLPRFRDFRGLSPDSFDGRGNYNLGIREQIVFPEIDYDKIDRVRGLQVTIITTAKRDSEARSLLELMGMPLRKN
ncbi:MAG: 50S ribosomal protein L5 [Chloroflexi bacterium]|nr:50S ribosomal protein L5 [Chloroflexota bacterium]MCK4580735.1 50S ribosomal protein L5 [Dehalococcoidia bacterium]